tara:strand:+ start:1158 stop:1271 length:114 start_codon:yes stop_codon:yes gene_type:complete
MKFSELVELLKIKEKDTKQQTKNKQRTKVLRKRIRHG